jgi:hypothetical protein
MLDGRFAHQVAVRRDRSDRVAAMKDRSLRPDRIDLKFLGAPMKKRSLFLAVAAGLLVLGVGAPKSQAGSLASLLGTTVSYGGLDFTFDSWVPTGTAPSAADVNVTFVTAGGEVGFTLNSSFGAGPGATSDGNLLFNVSGAKITDAFLTGNPALNPGNTTGLASVTETIYGGPNILGPIIGNLYIQNSPPGPLSASATFSPWTTITVNKDIEAIGGSTGASLSSVSQLFSSSTVPEPVSYALLGIGMTGILFVRRFFKKTSVA